MNDQESTIILTRHNEVGCMKNTYRLFETLLSSEWKERLAYSIFMTTEHAGKIEEAFIFDLTHRKEEAICFLNRIDEGTVTACTLREVAHDYVLEPLLFP